MSSRTNGNIVNAMVIKKTMKNTMTVIDMICNLFVLGFGFLFVLKFKIKKTVNNIGATNAVRLLKFNKPILPLHPKMLAIMNSTTYAIVDNKPIFVICRIK